MIELPEPRPSTLDEVIDTRRHLHRHPEVSFDEHQTSHLITKRLESLGLTIHDCPTETGALATLEGGRPGRTIMLRADIDALPILEESGVDFPSAAEGRMHACGHDGHTAMLLGVARTLSEVAEDLAGQYLFVFQPAEEIVEGAKAMIERGFFNAHHPDAALALHLQPAMESGTVAMKPGLQWGGSDAFEVLLQGPGGHGGLIRRAGNVLAAQAFVVSRLDTIVEGLEAEGTPALASVGDVRTDGLFNVVPRRVWIYGSFRTFNAPQRAEAIDRFRGLLLETESEFQIRAELKLIHGTVPMINDVAVTRTVLETGRELIGARAIQLDKPMTVSDDMAEFLVHVPGCYFNLGARPAGLEVVPSLHQSTMRIDEAAFATGVRVMAGSAVRLAEGEVVPHDSAMNP